MDPEDLAFRNSGAESFFLILGVEWAVGSGRPKWERMAGLDEAVEERIEDLTEGETVENFCRTAFGTCSESCKRQKVGNWFHSNSYKQSRGRTRTSRFSKWMSTSSLSFILPL